MASSSGKTFGGKAVGFDGPIQLPRDDEQHRQWRAANRAWWESAPMRYDWRDEITYRPGSEDYYKEIDRRFFVAAQSFMRWRKLPFDAVIPFDKLCDKDVLEIGIGQGTHAELLAAHSKSYTGIDLTSAAVTMTAARLKLFALSGLVAQMDAESMGFRSSSFDYVWSWGVIHHAADVRRVIKEIHRVLRPGGTCTVMVYYRSWWNYYVFGLLRGLFSRQWRRLGSLHHVSQSGTDGAIARYYKPVEWRRLTCEFFAMDFVKIYGLKSDVVPLPHGRAKQLVMDMLPDALARFLSERLRMGSLLVAHMRKAGASE
jgi:SAM-dependent methyltransferase